MTRLLCTADLHIGAGTDHRVDALADQEQVLDQIVYMARDREVDAVLLAGDVFHRPKPTPAELHVFARFARQLERAGIPTVACLGNAGHDQLGADLPSALELFAHGDWMRVSRIPELIKCVGDVAVCTLPSVPIARLVAMRGGGDRAETVELAELLLVDVARELRAQVPEGWPSILMGHWSVSGASLPNGLPVATLSEPVLPLEELEALGFDAMVFGHIHRPQSFESRPFASPSRSTFYTGSPMIMDFGEASFEHGVWIVGFGAGKLGDLAPEFVPLDDRRFVTVNVNLAGEALRAVLDGAMSKATGVDETDAIAEAIVEQFPLAAAVVRVTYRATEGQHRRVDHAALTALLDDAGVHKVYGGIHWEPVRETRARVAGVDEQLDPLEAVDAWCRANDIPDHVAVELRQETRSYLEAAA